MQCLYVRFITTKGTVSLILRLGVLCVGFRMLCVYKFILPVDHK